MEERRQMLLIIAFLVGVSGQNHHGPVFLQEPPARLTFSNTTGSQVSCSAHGYPSPLVQWLLQDGSTVSAVPGLRQSLGNGTLYFPPFRAEDYRKDVHFTVYRCQASNIAGTIISRDVFVDAVVNQHYEIQVYHTHVLAGNSAVMVCVIPSFVKDYVTVTSWSREDSILLPGSNMGGRIIVTYGSGELHIRSARAEDGLVRYSCLTRHSLTQERKRSMPAILTVTEPAGSSPPRLAPTVQNVVSGDRETDIHLVCSAQGNPPPTFTWYREVGGHLQQIFATSRYEPLQDILLVRRVKPEDAGRWVCKISNQFGEQHLDINLSVTAHLSVHVLPQLQVVNSGETGTFNCSVSGSPVGQVQWYKNGELLPMDGMGKIKLVNALVLSIAEVTRHDRGMYQCIGRNDRESAQGSAELRLGDTIPELQYTFIEQALRPGLHVSLRCSGTGSPPPQFTWFLDGQPVSEYAIGHRFVISQYVDHTGDVITHLNISNVRVDDGGLYTCKAFNSLGAAEHSARLNIYGPPFIRSIGPVKAVAGAEIHLHCPYSGYPVETVRWERHGQELSMDLRHKLTQRGSLVITKLDPAIDSGYYACFVSSRDGANARREIQLVVNSPPVLEPFSFPASLTEGGRAQVTCYVTSGDMPIHFSWNKDGEPISANLQVEERAAEFYSMLIFKEVTSSHSGSYTCLASNAAARTNYTAQLMVKVAPRWIVEPHDSSVLLGEDIVMDCSASGFPIPQITWLKGSEKTSSDFRTLEGQNTRATYMANGSLFFDSVSPHNEGYYLCRAANGIGAGLSKVIFLTVNEPVRFDIPVRNISTKRGTLAVLLCNVYGDTPIEVLWMFNNKRLDINNIKYSITSTKTDNGIAFQVTINRTDRDDTGAYKCLAENAFGRGEHIINLAVQEKPDPPSSLEIIEVVSRSVRLSWNKPFNGNSPVIGYLVQYQVLGNGDWTHSQTVNVTLPATSRSLATTEIKRETASVAGLSPATVYTIRMAAVNSIDQSAFTEAVVVKTQEEEPSAAPKDIMVEPIGPGELFVTWTVPPRETWNGELIGYIISCNEKSGTLNSSKSVTVKGWATTKTQLIGLKKFTKYDINIRAFNSVSPGPPSISIETTTKEGLPEAPPGNIMCSQKTSQIMKISWTPPPAHLHGGLIQGYKVFYRPVSDNINIPNTAEVKRTASSETYVHGLYKYTNYSIKVLAFTGAGDGVMSQPLYCTTEEDLPGPPGNIKAAAQTSESIMVSWLPPEKPNGRISHYTVYSREEGRVGKHSSQTVRPEDITPLYGLMYEVRNLKERQKYEFWVSATTTIGEGTPTAVVTQTTNTNAPSRIVSFNQVLYKSQKAKVFLPCLSVGKPAPRTRWFHHDRPITFSPFFQVTPEGHLNIHSADESLSGNYTCIAKNLFGEDTVTYSLVVLKTPNAPQLQIQFTTTKGLRVQWSPPDDGGTPIQGYSLHIKHPVNNWTAIDLSPEHTSFTVDGLKCGSVYNTFLTAHNRVGKSNPSTVLRFTTKGGPPVLPKENDFIFTNATNAVLNLFSWPDGGCAITHFTINFRAIGKREWNLISNSISPEQITIQDLNPLTWYQIKIQAFNEAGNVHGIFNFATTSLTGERIVQPPLIYESETSEGISFNELYVGIVCLIFAIVVISISLFWFVIIKRKRNMDNSRRQSESNLSKGSAERDNIRNCQQVYTSSPIKPKKCQNDSTDMYEISPYATFSVAGNNSRSVTASTLDYTMQFKTFGHIEDDEHNMGICSKNKHSWHKYRYNYNNEATTKIGPRPRITDSDSESSGSPGTESHEPSNYRVPVKSCRGERPVPPKTLTYSGYETLLVSDLFRPDSSTESNDVSPLTERRHTPRHVGGPSGGRRRHHHPSSSR